MFLSFRYIWNFREGNKNVNLTLEELSSWSKTLIQQYAEKIGGNPISTVRLVKLLPPVLKADEDRKAANNNNNRENVGLQLRIVI
jgi:hypothetical protein